MKTVLVVAVSLEEFNDYIKSLILMNVECDYRWKESGVTIIFSEYKIEYIYVNTVKKMRGFRNVVVQFIGSWIDLPEANELAEMSEVINYGIEMENKPTPKEVFDELLKSKSPAEWMDSCLESFEENFNRAKELRKKAIERRKQKE